MDPDVWLYAAVLLGLGALALAGLHARRVASAPPGDDSLVSLMDAIRRGAVAFLRREYTAISVVIVVFASVVFLVLDWARPWGAVAYVFGAVLSATAGLVGMRVATAANARTTEAARRGGTAAALPVAFSGGAVMGFTVSGLGLLGFASAILFLDDVLGMEPAQWGRVVAAIGLGAASIALFARVGGGIFTKAADVGADLVGKVEAGIPEDDPRNPATIADIVGDNVGDVAGMGADLFDSYVGSLVAPVLFAVVVFGGSGAPFTGQAVAYPMLIASIGMLGSIIGSFLVRPGGAGLAAILERGAWAATLLTLAGVAVATPLLFADVAGVDHYWGFFIAVVVGLIVGVAIGRLSMIFTSDHHRVVKEVARQAQTGPATIVLAGIAEGKRSAAYSVIVAAAGMGAAFWAGDWAVPGGGIYGVAIAAIGLLATLGMTVSVDSYGPIADNAGGIAEMAGLPAEVRAATDELDAVGKRTAAVAKGFAIGSAAVTALALFFTFTRAVGLQGLNLLDIWVIVGLFVGAMFPYLFAAMTIQAVGRAANQMITEVRRQFAEIPGLRQGEPGVVPDYARCVDISTQASLREMILPGSLAVALPLAAGFVSVELLGGVLAGALTSGFLLAISMANAGGAWDSAKKLIETGAFGGMGSDAHRAAVVADTIGDPFKDAAGPAMNIVIKLMTVVSLVFSSAFVGHALF